jgi:zinc D-Ala-D-Ala carboxypeptidase
MREDIPEALREAKPSPIANSQRLPRSQAKGVKFLLFAALGFLVALLASWFLVRGLVTIGTNPAGMNPASSTMVSPVQSPSPMASPAQSPSQSPSLSQSPSPSQAPVQASPVQDTSTLLGHLAYAEAPAEDLQALSSDGTIRLRQAALAKYEAMVAAAQQDGVELLTISGFRSLKDQNHLFFDVKAERRQGPTERAQVSAPPGYSEHHTGYAVDMGDRSRPETNLNSSFEDTPAFRWLSANAARYSFELSFPRNNRQGVMYEPWHWRFVGDSDSLKTFYAARQQQQPASTAP